MIGMDERGNVVQMWPAPEGVAERWAAARLRITLQLVYGRTGEHRAVRRRCRASMTV